MVVDFESLNDSQKASAISRMEQALKNQDARSQLSFTDWRVIRELERMFLSDTELSKAREALRGSVVDLQTIQPE